MKKLLFLFPVLILVLVLNSENITGQNLLGNFLTSSHSYSSNYDPSYVQKEAKRVSELVRSVQNQNTFTILAVSDLHYWKGNVDVNNSLNDMIYGVKALLSQIHVDYKIAFGDYIYRTTGGYEDYKAGVEEMQAATKILNECFYSYLF